LFQTFQHNGMQSTQAYDLMVGFPKIKMLMVEQSGWARVQRKSFLQLAIWDDYGRPDYSSHCC